MTIPANTKECLLENLRIRRHLRCAGAHRQWHQLQRAYRALDNSSVQQQMSVGAPVSVPELLRDAARTLITFLRIDRAKDRLQLDKDMALLVVGKFKVRRLMSTARH